MSLEEFENTPDAKAKRYVLMKTIMDLGMGIIYIGIGIIIFFPKQLHLNINVGDNIIAKIFAVIVVIYGGWRIYRGIKKDYFRET